MAKKPTPKKVSEEEAEAFEETDGDLAVETAPEPQNVDVSDPQTGILEGVDFGNEAEAEAMAKAAPPPAVEASQIPRPPAPPPRQERAGPRPFNFPSRRDTSLPPGKMKRSSGLWNEWGVRLPVGTTPEQVLDPTYFRHYIRGSYVQLRSEDIVHVMCEDLSWEARYRVMMVGEAEVLVSMIGDVTVHAQPSQAVVSDLYEVRTVGTRSMVIHRENKDVVQDNLASPSAAYDWIAGHLRSMQR